MLYVFLVLFMGKCEKYTKHAKRGNFYVFSIDFRNFVENVLNDFFFFEFKKN